MQQFTETSSIPLIRNFFLPDTPIFFVLIGEYSNIEYEILKKYLGTQDIIVYIQICDKEYKKIQDENAIHIPCDKNGDPVYLQKQKKYLGQKLRKIKRHKFDRTGDVSVYVLMDEFTEMGQILFLLEQLYVDLHRVFYGHVYVDIYCLVKEYFPGNEKNEMTYNLLQVTERLEKKEWVRFVFLISEMNNEEVLMEREDLYLMIAESIMLGCNNKFLSGNKSLYEKILQHTLANGSKLLTLGRMSLDLPEKIKWTMLRYSILQELDQTKNKKAQAVGVPDFAILKYDIMNCINALENGAESIGYYQESEGPEAILKNMSCYDFLCYIYGGNAEDYVSENSVECLKEGKKITKKFCNTQLLPYLNDGLKNNAYIFLASAGIKKYISQMLEGIEQLILSNLQERTEKQKEISEWKQKKVCVDFPYYWKRKNKIAFSILKVWMRHTLDLLLLDTYNTCLSDIRNYVLEWGERMESRCQEFINYKRKIEHEWELAMRDCPIVKKPLLKAYNNILRTLFCEERFVLLNCCRELIVASCNGKMNSDILGEIIDKYAELFYEYEKKYFDASVEDDRQNESNKSFFDELYRAIDENKVLQMRGDITNIEPYLCFLGIRERPFLKYVEDRNDERKTLYFIDNYSTPVVLYFQNINKLTDLMAYLIYQKKYEEGKS